MHRHMAVLNGSVGVGAERRGFSDLVFSFAALPPSRMVSYLKAFPSPAHPFPVPFVIRFSIGVLQRPVTCLLWRGSGRAAGALCGPSVVDMYGARGQEMGLVQPALPLQTLHGTSKGPPLLLALAKRRHGTLLGAAGGTRPGAGRCGPCSRPVSRLWRQGWSWRGQHWADRLPVACRLCTASLAAAPHLQQRLRRHLPPPSRSGEELSRLLSKCETPNLVSRGSQTRLASPCCCRCTMATPALLPPAALQPVRRRLSPRQRRLGWRRASLQWTARHVRAVLYSRGSHREGACALISAPRCHRCTPGPTIPLQNQPAAPRGPCRRLSLQDHRSHGEAECCAQLGLKGNAMAGWTGCPLPFPCPAAACTPGLRPACPSSPVGQPRQPAGAAAGRLLFQLAQAGGLCSFWLRPGCHLAELPCWCHHRRRSARAACCSSWS